MVDSLLSWAPLSAQIWVVQMLAYHGIGLWFEWLDRSGRLQRFKFKRMERTTYFELLPRVLANQICILLPAMLFMQWAGLAYVGSPTVSLPVFVASVAFMTVGHDVLQYVAHRFILHRPEMMRRLGHAVHHSTIGSLGISACYMSAADFFLEIVCPYLIPLAFAPLGSNFLVHSLVVAAGAFGGLYEHSGYDFAIALREPAGRANPGTPEARFGQDDFERSPCGASFARQCVLLGRLRLFKHLRHAVSHALRPRSRASGRG